MNNDVRDYLTRKHAPDWDDQLTEAQNNICYEFKFGAMRRLLRIPNKQIWQIIAGKEETE